MHDVSYLSSALHACIAHFSSRLTVVSSISLIIINHFTVTRIFTTSFFCSILSFTIKNACIP
ncbi:hypothetical protein CW304_16545 [Bacillus sp. UFRGS-B20]|nr:hypothetical protein CW304_16545 [Bacillus sp. UFRGS-B20]